MDNPQDQPGTSNAASGRTSADSGTSAGATTGASAAARKSAAMPDAQSTSAASGHNTTTDGTNRQGEGQQTNAQSDSFLDSTLNNSKQWIEDSGMLDSVNQMPQALKDLGNRALDKVNSLTTTQKVVGGAILAAGIGWLATRKGKSSSSDSSSYNYGRQRDAGSYGRRNYGYQAPDASTSRRPAVGTPERTDSGSPYGNGSRYGSSAAGNTGIQSGSGRSGSGYGSASAGTDHGSQHSSGSYRSSKDDGFGDVE